jgi:NAD dependent epimerase/dehydratase family enzyme
MSWIHRLDWIEIVRWLIETNDISGPVNATAPEPVTNRTFARALGHAMHRPGFIPTPGFAVTTVLGGERAKALVLTGQRVIPARAQSKCFHFRYPEIDLAFRGIFGE